LSWQEHFTTEAVSGILGAFAVIGAALWRMGLLRKLGGLFKHTSPAHCPDLECQSQVQEMVKDLKNLKEQHQQTHDSVLRMEGYIEGWLQRNGRDRNPFR